MYQCRLNCHDVYQCLYALKDYEINKPIKFESIQHVGITKRASKQCCNKYECKYKQKYKIQTRRAYMLTAVGLHFKPITCIGVADDAMVVNPQMSDNNTVMHEQFSGKTFLPEISWSATWLK